MWRAGAGFGSQTIVQTLNGSGTTDVMDMLFKHFNLVAVEHVWIENTSRMVWSVCCPAVPTTSIPQR